MARAPLLTALVFGLSGQKDASPVPLESINARTWWPLIREPFSGAWQRNVALRTENLLSHSAVYSCITLIASDIAKMCLRLVEQDENGIWTESTSNAYSPVLRRPNRYQNRIQFIQWWVTSKLTHGNTYVLKVRDNRGVVAALYILDPTRTKALVAPDGSVFYQLSTDNLSGITEPTVTVPASEIIHDVMNPLYHPLCGVSPITACSMAAVQGLAIQDNQTKLFKNAARPSGFLTAPGVINQETADRLKASWEENYSGENFGRTAVLGDGLEYRPMGMTAEDAQLIEQLKWSAETICSVFHVPPYKVQVGPPPSFNNIEALEQGYYTGCLQIHIESIELLLDEGLGIGVGATKDGSVYGTEFDLDGLLRMDTATQVKTLSEAVKGTLMKPNEARRKLNLGPVAGGDAVYAQQQDFSLEALAERDKNKPFAKPATANPPPPANENAPSDAEAAKALLAIHKGLAHV